LIQATATRRFEVRVHSIDVVAARPAEDHGRY
jgi:hypothetical protein